MPIADKISLLIAASKGSLAELELAKSHIPKECTSTVMSPTQTAIASPLYLAFDTKKEVSRCLLGFPSAIVSIVNVL